MGTVSHSGEKSVFSVEGEFPKRELWAEGLGALDRGNWAGGLTAVFAGGRLHRQADPTPALPLRVRAGRCARLPSRSFPAHGHMGAGPLQWGRPSQDIGAARALPTTHQEQRSTEGTENLGSFMESSFSDPELSTQSRWSELCSNWAAGLGRLSEVWIRVRSLRFMTCFLFTVLQWPQCTFPGERGVRSNHSSIYPSMRIS